MTLDTSHRLVPLSVPVSSDVCLWLHNPCRNCLLQLYELSILVIRGSSNLEVLFAESEMTYALNKYASTTTHIKILCRYHQSYKAGNWGKNFESMEETLEPDPIFTATEKRYYPYSFRYLWTLCAQIFLFDNSQNTPAFSFCTIKYGLYCFHLAHMKGEETRGGHVIYSAL